MKKIILLAAIIAMVCMLFTGCSNEGITIDINQKSYSTENESIENIRNELLALTDENGMPYFKEVSIQENKGIFYTLRTLSLSTNETFSETEIKITMPKNVTKYSNLEVTENVATALLAGSTEYSIMSENTNSIVTIVAIAFFTVVAAVFFIISKKKA